MYRVFTITMYSSFVLTWGTKQYSVGDAFDTPTQNTISTRTCIYVYVFHYVFHSAVAPFQPRKPLPRSVDDEDRLEKLFDRTHQVEREEQKMSEKETEDSLTTKMAALDQSNAHELVGGGEEEEEEEKEGDMGESGEVETNEGKVYDCVCLCARFLHVYMYMYNHVKLIMYIVYRVCM